MFGHKLGHKSFSWCTATCSCAFGPKTFRRDKAMLLSYASRDNDDDDDDDDGDDDSVLWR